MPVLSQESLGKMDGSVFIYGDGNLWSIANLTSDPSAAIVTASCAPLIISLKQCNEVSSDMLYCE